MPLACRRLVPPASVNVAVCRGVYQQQYKQWSALNWTYTMSMTSTSAPLVWIVDDDADIRELLSAYLEQNGFTVEVAEGGAELRKMWTHSRPDVLVLDLMMPGEDGLSLTRFVKSNGDVPTLMLSAKGEEMDRIIGLEVGADDYLAKPFSPRELLARLRALLRRRASVSENALDAASNHESALGSSDQWAFGAFRLHGNSRTLKLGQTTINLTTAEYDLLEVFVRRPHRVLSRDVLISLLKGYERDAFDRSIDNRVTRLRKKIEADPANPQFIRTVRGEGYLFNPGGELA